MIGTDYDKDLLLTSEEQIPKEEQIEQDKNVKEVRPMYATKGEENPRFSKYRQKSLMQLDNLFSRNDMI